MGVEFWTKEVAAIAEAPVAFVLALAVIAGIIWKLVTWVTAAQVEGLKTQMAAMQARLDLAFDKEKSLIGVIEPLRRQLDLLQVQIQSNQPAHVVTVTSSDARSMLDSLDDAAIALSQALRPLPIITLGDESRQRPAPR